MAKHGASTTTRQIGPGCQTQFGICHSVGARTSPAGGGVFSQVGGSVPMGPGLANPRAGQVRDSSNIGVKVLKMMVGSSLLLAGCRGPEVAVPVEFELECPLPPDAENLAAFWRFDDGSTGEASSKDTKTDLRLDGPRGMLVEDRLGGRGHGALFLGGDAAAGRSVPASLDVASDLTLAAWVSLPEDWLAAPEVCADQERALEVVSVSDEGAGQARLEILNVVGMAPLLRVSVDAASGAREGCAELPSEFGHWGRGRWYHVAGTTGVSPVLYVGGEPAPSVQCPVPGRTYTTSPVSSGQLVAPEGCGFGRLLDDIALFQPPLSPAQLPGFLVRSSAVPGTDGRWWSAQGVEGSVAEWRCGVAYSRDEGGLQVYFDNKPWSAPRLVVELKPAPVQAFRSAVLRANIPAGEPFQLELEGRERNHYCAWPVVGKGDTEYVFSAEDVGWCECPGECPCDFTVTRASIESRWDTSSRYPVSVFDIDLDFQPGLESPAPSEPRPRTLDALDWCWRPVAYDPTARARLGPSEVANTFAAHLGAPVSSEAVGTLDGAKQTTSFLGADFVGMGAFLDIEGCERVRLETTVESQDNYAFRLVDAYGVVAVFNQNAQPEALIDLNEAVSWSPPQVRELGKLDPAAARFTPTMVRFVGIQKPWEEQWSESTVRVRSIAFETADGQTCAELTDAKLTAPLAVVEEVF